SLVGYSRADLFDQGRTSRFDRHTWQNGARSIRDNTRQGRTRLGACHGRHEYEKNRHHQNLDQCAHNFLLGCSKIQRAGVWRKLYRVTNWRSIIVRLATPFGYQVMEPSLESTSSGALAPMLFS